MSTSPDRRPTRVLWLVKGLGRGGAETLLVNAAQVHDRKRFAISAAYLLPWKSDLAADLVRFGVSVDCLGARTRWDPSWVVAFRRLLERESFDVVHFHSPLVAAQARLVVRSLPEHRRPSLISTEHNAWTSHGPVTRIANRVTFRLDDRHVAVSAATRDSIPPELRASVEVVVHGIVPDEASRARSLRDRTRASLEVGEGLLIITVANLRSHKGYSDLLEAAREVVTRVPGTRFIAVGHGPLQASLAAQHRELGLGDRFSFLGKRSDVLELLAAADIFVMASRYEGYPVALMEALAVGLPVVATAVGGIPDALCGTGAGVLIPPSEPARLAAALVELATDGRMRARLAEGAAAAGVAYDIAHGVGRLEAMYQGMRVDRRIRPATDRAVRPRWGRRDRSARARAGLSVGSGERRG